ncbi:hypothetical protein [Bacillus sp. ISL-46]|nr:hypothetical protein [Bacillus sp. ISL-46]MBT2722309.1 hypothetical protein [Bacillus sp. ISL-46]
MELHEIEARKAALKNTIDSYQRQIDPLEKELKDLDKLESQQKKKDK